LTDSYFYFMLQIKEKIKKRKKMCTLLRGRKKIIWKKINFFKLKKKFLNFKGNNEAVRHLMTGDICEHLSYNFI